MNMAAGNKPCHVTAPRDICAVEEIVPGTGMAARVDGHQIAIFNTGSACYAIGNRDPFSGANVLSRGILSELDGRLVVASPVYKQHFCLRTGVCLEDDSVSVPVWAAEARDGRIVLECVQS